MGLQTRTPGSRGLPGLFSALYLHVGVQFGTFLMGYRGVNPALSKAILTTHAYGSAYLDLDLKDYYKINVGYDFYQPAEKSFNAPTRTYVRDAKAMASTPADVKEYANSYVFIIDMPGLKSGDIKVQVEDDNMLLISGERKREEEKEGAKYVRMERRVGKLMRKFVLPENANADAISAVCQDGVLTVTVEKLPPPEPRSPRPLRLRLLEEYYCVPSMDYDYEQCVWLCCFFFFFFGC
ncbi:hypothetical protein GH714_029581 [Hevea brasiliensis]|uniref:SHSP domain-containing protein n=1 Tax=Hevea brasiliensis TaxID=3981 RepID=A0A6A6LW79_HEVBR|nr:hypothetical protein GH714_029581 [Hevea brasiliensis]